MFCLRVTTERTPTGVHLWPQGVSIQTKQYGFLQLLVPRTKQTAGVVTDYFRNSSGWNDLRVRISYKTATVKSTITIDFDDHPSLRDDKRRPLEALVEVKL